MDNFKQYAENTKIDNMLYYLSNQLSDDTLPDVDLPTFSEIKVVVAILNCYFSAWRDEQYIRCVGCGELIKNSKQRNRKYCDNCKVNSRKTNNKSEILKTCIDCRVKFYPNSNREVRCIDCQIKANKAAARERARRYRERKRNGLGSKS